MASTNRVVAMKTPAERVWSEGGRSHQTRQAREKAERKEARDEMQASRWWSTR